MTVVLAPKNQVALSVTWARELLAWCNRRGGGGGVEKRFHGSITLRLAVTL